MAIAKQMIDINLLMDRSLPIHKQELEQLLEDWGHGKISCQELHIWAECNYLPLHIEIAPDEKSCIQSAMHRILNEFDLGNPDYFKADNYQVAIDFMNCTEENFKEKEKEFIDKCFKS